MTHLPTVEARPIFLLAHFFQVTGPPTIVTIGLLLLIHYALLPLLLLLLRVNGCRVNSLQTRLDAIVLSLIVPDLFLYILRLESHVGRSTIKRPCGS